jgi:SAM-dependent methyltransferase
MSTTQEREREFHNRTFAEHSRQSLEGVYAILHDSRICYEQVLAAHCSGRHVLEYGCGPGSHTPFLAAHGAEVIGIDISEVAVGQARERAAEAEFTATFRVMDAEHLEFPDDSFDLICSVAILHHLDLERAFAEIARTLKPSGTAVFMEPLGHNPAINLYRRLTPHLRSADEHPLLMRDIDAAGAHFGRVERRFFTLNSLLAVPFRRTRYFMRVLTSLEALDRALFRIIPFARRLAWQVVVILSEPKKARG